MSYQKPITSYMARAPQMEAYRRDREGEFVEPGMLPSKSNAKVTCYCKLAHWFDKDPKTGLGYGKCRNGACPVMAHQNPMPRNCEGNSKWELQEDGRIREQLTVSRDKEALLRALHEIEQEEKALEAAKTA